MTQPDEAVELLPGDNSGLRYHRPELSAIFYAAAGVVTDVGAQMSHGPIVSRELGIPAVVNTRRVTKWIRTGDRIRVDGTNGTVEVMERADDASRDHGDDRSDRLCPSHASSSWALWLSPNHRLDARDVNAVEAREMLGDCGSLTWFGARKWS